MNHLTIFENLWFWTFWGISEIKYFTFSFFTRDIAHSIHLYLCIYNISSSSGSFYVFSRSLCKALWMFPRNIVIDFSIFNDFGVSYVSSVHPRDYCLLDLSVDYIIEKEPLVNKFISVPKDKGLFLQFFFFFFYKTFSYIYLLSVAWQEI